MCAYEKQRGLKMLAKNKLLKGFCRQMFNYLVAFFLLRLSFACILIYPQSLAQKTVGAVGLKRKLPEHALR